jgi:integrase
MIFVTNIFNFSSKNRSVTLNSKGFGQIIKAARRHFLNVFKNEPIYIGASLLFSCFHSCLQWIRNTIKSDAAVTETKSISLTEYTELFIEQVVAGTRQTDHGRNYASSTIKTIRQSLKQFMLYQLEKRRIYDFSDIDMSFYYDYTAFLKGKGYSVNTIGKCVRQLKAVLHAAELDGIPVNSGWKDRRFRGYRVDVDSIYLTQAELDLMMAVDLSGMSPHYEHVRDIFMVGVFTAQRVSDYSHICKNDFKTVRNEKQEILYLNIYQRKTGTKVAIPCNGPMKAILGKYNYQLPHLDDHLINRLIKEIARMAGLTESVEIMTTKGGVRKRVRYEKWQLVHSHTARRTGATLMYLAGVDLYDIMRVTGHSSPLMLKKYIKADTLEVVEKLSEKYDYFK